MFRGTLNFERDFGMKEKVGLERGNGFCEIRISGIRNCTVPRGRLGIFSLWNIG